MPTFYPDQVFVLLFIAAAKAGVACDSKGMKAVFDAIEARFTDHKSINTTEKYLQNLLRQAVGKKTIGMSESRANALAEYIGFTSYVAYTACYEQLLRTGAAPGHEAPLTIIGESQLIRALQDDHSTLLHHLPAVPLWVPYKSIDDLSPERVTTDREQVVFVLNDSVIQAGLTPAHLDELLPDGYLLYWDEYSEGSEQDTPFSLTDGVLRDEAELTVLLALAGHGYLGKPSGKPAVSPPVDGTLIQGNVCIRQTNHGPGQQMVSSKDIHITNNHYYNKA